MFLFYLYSLLKQPYQVLSHPFFQLQVSQWIGGRFLAMLGEIKFAAPKTFVLTEHVKDSISPV